MKRSRPTTTQDNLGALEFAAVINSGDDAARILDCLKRFTKIVRKERHLALSGGKENNDESDSSNSSSSSEEDADHETMESEQDPSPQRKKFKEAWKEDTNAYHVPFVGTSVATGRKSVVRKGEWPTGLLKEYLDKSPLAVELTGDALLPETGHIHKTLLRRKQGKLSQIILKAYLKALAELVTAAIPKAILQREYQSSNNIETTTNNISDSDQSQPRFLTTLVKERLPTLLKLIQTDTKRGNGPCGPLVPTILLIFENLVLTGVTLARQIARELEQSLSVEVWKTIIRLPPLHKPKNQDVSEQSSSKTRKSQREASRIAFLQLTQSMISHRDPTVWHYATALGSRDRKVAPGLLVMALRDAIGNKWDHDNEDTTTRDAYYEELADFLQFLRQKLLPSTQSLSLRGWSEVLSHQVLQNLCDLSLMAPPLDKADLYSTVLGGTDTAEDDTTLEIAGRQARQILWLLLFNPSKSPLLQFMSKNIDNHQPSSGQYQGNGTEQGVVRIMCRLLDKHPMVGKVALHACLVAGFKGNSVLLPALLQSLTMPDSIKYPVAFLARLRLIFLLLTLQDDIALVMPAAVKKNTLTKVLQLSNSMIVCETLKVMLYMLERLQAKPNPDTGELALKIITEAFPDVQVLLACLSRFDINDESNSSAPFVCGYVAKLLKNYATAVPEVLRNVKFDWMNLLPKSAEIFCRLPLFLQMQLLHTLETLLTVHTVWFDAPASCQLMLGILTQSRVESIYMLTRHVCQAMIGRIAALETPSEEKNSCFEYEFSCWIDFITPNIVPEFCSVLSEASQTFLKCDILLYQAWKSSGITARIPSFYSSPILVAAMRYLAEGESSIEMRAFVGQVAVKCLLYHHIPLPQAALMKHFYEIASKKTAGKSDSNQIILDYASSLITFDSVTSTRRNEMLLDLVSTTFSKRSIYYKIIIKTIQPEKQAQDLIQLLDGISREEAVALVRQVSHMLACSEENSIVERCTNTIRFLMPLALEGTEKDDALLNCISNRLEQFSLLECLSHIDMMAASLPRNKCIPSSCRQRLRASVHDFWSIAGDYSSQSDSITNGIHFERILLLIFLKNFLPLDIMGAAIEGVAKQLEKRDDHRGRMVLASVANSFVQEVITRPDTNTSIDYALSIRLFKLWYFITGLIRTGSIMDGQSALISNLEELLCRGVAGISCSSARLYIQTLQLEPDDLVERLVASKALCYPGAKNSSCMLACLIQSDPPRFTQSLIDVLCSSTVKENKAEALWLIGGFDDAVEAALKNARNVDNNQLRKLFELVVQRARCVLQEKDKKKQDGHHVYKLLHLVKRGDLDGAVDFSALIQELEPKLKSDWFVQTLEDLGAVSQDDFLHATLEISLASSIENRRCHLSALFFAHLCGLLPRSLRKRLKNLDTATSASSTAHPHVLLEMLLQLESQIPSFDPETLNAVSPGCFPSALRACLKYGMMKSTSSLVAESAAKCLRLARQMLLRVNSLSALGKKSFEFPTAHGVFDMITSHSNFEGSLALPSPRGPYAERRIELSRLLLTCVSCSEITIEINDKVWKILFGAYDASVGVFDCTLRRLFTLVVTKQREGRLPFLDQFRWRGVPSNETDVKKDATWDWLIDGLHLGRVFQTLRAFPVDDVLVPKPLTGIESLEQLEIGTAKDNRQAMVHWSVDGGEEGMDPATAALDSRDGQDDEESYSPAYILPLILGALEWCMEQGSQDHASNMKVDHTKDSSANGNGKTLEEHQRSHELLARTVQRLIEKGALSLALASLCSRCASVRQVAVAVLGIFMRSLESKQALNISSLRERPQLAMLLRSVQRALSQRRAKLLSEDSTSNKTLSRRSAWEVPLIPSFSALFLARAAWVLSRPGDNMYAPINQLFLSIEDDHGAFRDMNRLPAFVTFLCSFADEPDGQAGFERVWALKLFRDGFRNEHCFKLAAACHAPELLLTTIYNNRTREMGTVNKSKENECVIAIEALNIMIQNGGLRAAHHLFTRMGLLSWIRSVLESGFLRDTFPSNPARIAFLDLLAVSVRQATYFQCHDQETRNNDEEANVNDRCFFFEVAALAKPSLTLCLPLLKDLNRHDAALAEKNEMMSSATSASLQALRSLQNALEACKALKEDRDTYEIIRDDGIEISMASEFLFLLPPHSESFPTVRRQCVGALATLPFSSSPNRGDTVKFALECLELMATLPPEQSSKNWVMRVMGRLLSVLNDSWKSNKMIETANRDSYREASMQSDRRALMTEVLQCRRVCFQWKESRALWFRCMLCILPEENGSPANDDANAESMHTGDESSREQELASRIDSLLLDELQH